MRCGRVDCVDSLESHFSGRNPPCQGRIGKRTALDRRHTLPSSPLFVASRRCKADIWLCLKDAPHVADVQLERGLGEVRAGVSANVNGIAKSAAHMSVCCFCGPPMFPECWRQLGNNVADNVAFVLERNRRSCASERSLTDFLAFPGSRYAHSRLHGVLHDQEGPRPVVNDDCADLGGNHSVLVGLENGICLLRCPLEHVGDFTRAVGE
jgi:hypothetical protein